MTPGVCIMKGHDVKQAKTLIDRARTMVQSDRELAAALDIYPQELALMKSGKRPLSPTHVGMLCDLLKLNGDEAREWLAIAVCENAKDEKQGVLRRAFFVYSALLIAGLQVLGAALLAATPQSAEATTVRASNAAEPGRPGVDNPQIVRALRDRFIHCGKYLRAFVRARWFRSEFAPA
jgi:hypothetical protein